MKQTLLYVINALLVVAVLVLFMLQFSKKDKAIVVEGTNIEVADRLPIAYVALDSLLTNYYLYNEMSAELMQEGETARLNLNQKAKLLQDEMADFQKKVENRVFSSEQRARSEQERLMNKQQQLQELAGSMEQNLVIKQQRMNEELMQVVDSVVTDYNKDKAYHLILTGNVLHADKAYNITDEVLEMLNGKQEKED